MTDDAAQPNHDPIVVDRALPAQVRPKKGGCELAQRRVRVDAGVVLVAMAWAISIHTVTAFLFSANAGRPLWHSALLGPRFIASAFASGPALIILALQLIRRVTDYPIAQTVVDTLSLVMTVALQISLFFVLAELFTDFYNETSHAGSIRYLFFGLGGVASLKPWIWAALVMNLVAVTILSIHTLRTRTTLLNLACVLVFAGIWIEKGMGLIVPAFVPSPLGEIVEYLPTLNETLVALGVWAAGLLVYTILVRVTVPVLSGQLSVDRGYDPVAAPRGSAHH